MKTVSRIDKARITGGIKRNADGSLQGTAIVARSGILEYFEGGKIIRELIRPEELGKADSIATLQMKPITNDHPSVSAVTPQNVKQFQCGFTGETVSCQDGKLSTTLTINEDGAIQDVSKGKRELSCSYVCQLDDKPGMWEGQRYDREQLNRVYNHVAIVDLGRAGKIASLHLDAADVFECGEVVFKDDDSTKIDSVINPHKGEGLMKLTINGVTGEFTEQQVADHVAKQDKAIADAAKAHKDALDVVTADRDTLKDKLEKLDAKVKADAAALPTQIAAAAKARIDLERLAIPHMDKADVEKIATLSDIDVKKVVIVKAFPKVELKDASDIYVQARFDSACDVLKNDRIDEVATANRKETNGDVKNDGCDKGADKKMSKEDAEEAVSNRYKTTKNRDSIMK
jgi:uncharacterized protein